MGDQPTGSDADSHDNGPTNHGPADNGPTDNDATDYGLTDNGPTENGSEPGLGSPVGRHPSAEDGTARTDSEVSKAPGRTLVPIVAAVVIGLVGILLFRNDPADLNEASDPNQAGVEVRQIDPTEQNTTSGSEASAASGTRSTPPELLAAERFAASPSANALRQLIEAVGGFDGLIIATTEGAFDLVQFDPRDPNRLLASHRRSYGEAQNQDTNELWEVTPDGEVERSLWNPSVSHDFVHYNPDGSATMWVHGGGPGFAPRVAVVLDNNLTPVHRSQPMFASRFAGDRGTVFALTGNGEYYTNDNTHQELVADRGSGPQTLDDGAGYRWIEVPSPGILVAYPSDPTDPVAVWETETLRPLADHPLTGRKLKRVGVSGDGTTAVGVTSSGELTAIDLQTGDTITTFGQVEVTGVDDAVVVSRDGTVVVTVEQDGTVSLWWVGDDTPVLSVPGASGQPRWVPDRYAPLTTSAVAADAERVALMTAARGRQPTSWTIIDTDPTSLVEQARRLGEAKLP